MSAWYVFSAMGFYPFNPCGGDYVIGAPQVPKVELRVKSEELRVGGMGEKAGGSQLVATAKTVGSRVPRDRVFTIVAKNFSKENKYVKSVTLNGKPLDSFILKHADIMAGGELVFEMSSCAR